MSSTSIKSFVKILISLGTVGVKYHIFELSIEVKFLLYYYSKLFNTLLPKKTKSVIYNGLNSIPSYDEFEQINLDKSISKKNALILFLTHDNKFIIIAKNIIPAIGKISTVHTTVMIYEII